MANEIDAVRTALRAAAEVLGAIERRSVVDGEFLRDNPDFRCQPMGDADNDGSFCGEPRLHQVRDRREVGFSGADYLVVSDGLESASTFDLLAALKVPGQCVARSMREPAPVVTWMPDDSRTFADDDTIVANEVDCVISSFAANELQTRATGALVFLLSGGLSALW